MHRPLALTGTPGCGKSRTAARLAEWDPIEVGDLAQSLGSARRDPHGALWVDLRRMRREWVRRRPEPRLIVGHLSHLLPLRDVVVLRCHPVELARRLGRARRGTPRERYENVVSEAIDLVASEARGLRRRVWEIDTSTKSVPEVAAAVRKVVRGPPTGRAGSPRWLDDPAVTAWLLRHRP